MLHLRCYVFRLYCFFFFQAEDGIRDLVRSRGLGDVYKRQFQKYPGAPAGTAEARNFIKKIA